MARIRAEKAAGKRASAGIDIKPLKPVGKPRTVSQEDAFVMANTGNVMTETPYSEGSKVGAATVYHQGPGRVQLWKPGADGHFTPRDVSNNSVAMLLRLGWRTTCPDCNTNHEDSEFAPKDPNSCPARPHVAWVQCPVVTCKKRLFDHMGRRIAEELAMHGPETSDADAFIRLEGTFESTPEDRVKHEFLMHMWHRHPREAEMRHLPKLTPDLMPVQQTR